MPKKVLLRLVAFLLFVGISIIGLVSSVLIRTPKLFGTPTPTEMLFNELSGSIELSTDQVLPVNTATADYINSPSKDDLNPPLTIPTPAIYPPTQKTSLQSATQKSGQTGDNICGRNDFVVVLVSIADIGNVEKKPFIYDIFYFLFDFTKGSRSVLSFPVSQKLSGQTIKRLNLDPIAIGQLYEYVVNNVTDTTLDPEVIAINIMAQSIYDEFDIVPEYYAALTPNAFTQLVDKIGGLQVTLEKDILNLSEGEHQLNGLQTWNFVNNLSSSEIAQLEANQIILDALDIQFEKPGVMTKLPGLMVSFKNLALTNLDAETISDLICAIENSNFEYLGYEFEIFK
jgi:hypothetical protein